MTHYYVGSLNHTRQVTLHEPFKCHIVHKKQIVRHQLTNGQLFANYIIVLESVPPDLNLHIKNYGQYCDYSKTGKISGIFHVRRKAEELRNLGKAFS